MIRTTLGEIAGMIPGAATTDGAEGLRIAGVSKDTRDIRQDSLYIPLIGERFDGHEFVREAIDNGAAGTLWQRDRGDAPEGVPAVLVDDTLAALQQLASAYRGSLQVKVIGITGSNGKTSTKDMVHAVLASTFRVHKTQGNLNNHIGLPLTILELDQTTEFAVLEMGMSGRGEIELLSRIAQPDCAIVTNIGEAHMLQLGSREGIAEAKFEIIAGLKPGGVLIYHGDEPLLQALVDEQHKRLPYGMIRFGESSENDFYPEDVAISLSHSEFTACRSVGEGRFAGVRIPLLGRHNVINALTAVAVAHLFGVTEDKMKDGLGRMTPTGMRIETVNGINRSVLLNDAYNASPASMRAALGLLEEVTVKGRKIAVLGDMLELGPEAERFHRDIGKSIPPERIKFVLTYGKLGAYIAEECRARYWPGRVEAYEDKSALIDRLKRLIEPDDLVLVKASRGMKLEEVVEALALT